MNRLTTILLASLVLLIATGGVLAGSASPTQPTPAQMRAKIRAQASRISDLRDQLADANGVLAAQNQQITDQADTITKLRARDPLDAVLTRDADGQWQAILALWRGFPTLDSGVFCGYDKASSPPLGDGLVAASYTFYRWTGC